MKAFKIVASLIICSALCGCINMWPFNSKPASAALMAALDATYQEWVASGGLAESVSNYVADAQGGPATTVSEDMVDFKLLAWTYGGFKGGSSAYSEGEPKITGLRISGNKMSYSWSGPDLSRVSHKRWGYSAHDASALACLFVKNSDGKWVGGKFDWISSDRLTRGLENIETGYNGWSLSGVPNPCEAAFVIVNRNGKQRSNVITGTWKR